MRTVLAVSLLALGAACAGAPGGVQNGPLAGNVLFVGPTNLSRVIEANHEWVELDDTGLAVYQVELINTDNQDLKVDVRARWYDDDGLEIDSPVRAWRVLFIPAGSSMPARDVAPNAQAVRCRMEVRQHQPIEG